MRQKTWQFIEKHISEVVENYQNALNYYAKQVHSLSKEFDSLCKEVKAEKPALLPAWQARIISEHGVDSKDWKEFQKQIEQITRWINDKCMENNAERFILYYDPLNEHTHHALYALGYVTEPENDATRISW